MASSLLAFVSTALWAVSAALFAAVAFSAAGRVTYVTLADGRRRERSLPLSFRLLLPLAPNFRGLFETPAAARARERARADIVAAGFDGIIADWEFLSMRLLLPLATVLPWTLLVRAALRAAPRLQPLFPALVFSGIALAAVWPGSWLRAKVKARKAAIVKALPFALDLLTLSVEAGLDFMSALGRCAERAGDDPLSEEILRAVRETQLGATRRDALRAMADRAAVPDLRTAVSALVQADELGASLGHVLRVQSEQVRARRFERAEKLANEAPVKLLAPLALFIFPSVFLVLLGPVLLQMYRSV